jgi:hypothetical protein
MTPYSVQWLQEAEGELADAWVNSADRQQITKSQAEIDSLLAVDPLNVGTHVAEGLWKLTVQPLTVFYSVDTVSIVVEVASLMRIPVAPIGNVAEFTAQRPIEYGIAWVCFVRLLAILGGVFALRGSNWARWLLLVWIGYHVVLSAFHTLSQLAMHSLLFAVVAYFLFRPQVTAYFRAMRAEPATEAKDG